MDPVADPEVHHRKHETTSSKEKHEAVCQVYLRKRAHHALGGGYRRPPWSGEGPSRSTLPSTGPALPRRKCSRPPGRTRKQRHSHERLEMEAGDGGGRPSARRVHLRALTSSTTWRETAQEAREGRQERSQQAGPLRTDETHSTHHAHTGGAPPLRGRLCPAQVARGALHQQGTEGPRHPRDTSLWGRAGRAPRGQAPSPLREGLGKPPAPV